MFETRIVYSLQAMGLFVALVALQQVWGVDFETAVTRADQVLKGLIGQSRGRQLTYETEQVVEMMRSVAPTR